MAGYSIIPPRPGQPILQSNFVYSHAGQSSKKHFKSKRTHNNTIAQSTNANHKIPPNLFNLSRKQFAIIKSVHHLKLLEQSIPKTWKNWGDHINNNLRLAFISEQAKINISSTTSKYLEELRSISVNHYSTVIADASNHLKEHSSEFNDDTMKSSLELITRWAKQQLGNKLHANTLNDALAKIRETYSSTSSQNDNLVICCTNGRRQVYTSGPNMASAVEAEDTHTINRPAQATSKKTIKSNNSCRFFIHGKQVDEPTSSFYNINFSNYQKQRRTCGRR